MSWDCLCCGAYGPTDRGCCVDEHCHCHRGTPTDMDGTKDLNGFDICRACDAQERGEYYTRSEVLDSRGFVIGYIDTPVPRGKVRTVKQPNGAVMAHQVSGDELRTAVVRILDAWTARPPADHVKFPRVHGYARGVIDACGDFLALIDAQPALSFTEQEADRNARGES